MFYPFCCSTFYPMTFIINDKLTVTNNASNIFWKCICFSSTLSVTLQYSNIDRTWFSLTKSIQAFSMNQHLSKRLLKLSLIIISRTKVELFDIDIVGWWPCFHAALFYNCSGVTAFILALFEQGCNTFNYLVRCRCLEDNSRGLCGFLPLFPQHRSVYSLWTRWMIHTECKYLFYYLLSDIPSTTTSFTTSYSLLKTNVN